jgi:patched 2
MEYNLISSMNPMPIVQRFWCKMGIIALIHTCGMLLIFNPLMLIDAQQVKAIIVDLFIWLFCGFVDIKCTQWGHIR